MKIFSFCVLYTVLTFSHPKVKSYSFSISSQFNFKNRNIFQNFKRLKWKFNKHKKLIIQMIFIASCIEEIYLNILDKQPSWTYLRLLFELFLLIGWL